MESDHTVLQYFSINLHGGIHRSARTEFIAFVNLINIKLVGNSVPKTTAGTIRALQLALRNCGGEL